MHNITLEHAPVAKRTIGVIKNKIAEKLGEPRQAWWTEVDIAVEEYKRELVSRSTEMAANEEHKPENKTEVKTNLEAIRKLSNAEPTINVGGEVRVMVKKKFDNNCIPDWSDKTYVRRSGTTCVEMTTHLRTLKPRTRSRTRHVLDRTTKNAA